MRFITREIEEGNDTVNIFDGPTTSDPVLLPSNSNATRRLSPASDSCCAAHSDDCATCYDSSTCNAACYWFPGSATKCQADSSGSTCPTPPLTPVPPSPAPTPPPCSAISFAGTPAHSSSLMGTYVWQPGRLSGGRPAYYSAETARWMFFVNGWMVGRTLGVNRGYFENDACGDA